MIIGGVVGVVGASAYSYTNFAPMSLDMAGFALFGFLVGCGVAFPLINAIRFPIHVLASICLLVLTINLLAAGGISFPHVNVTFWFLAALCFACATAGTAEPSKTETTKSQQANIAFLCAALCFLVLLVALYPTAWLSNLQANTVARNMQANPAQFVFFDKKIAEFEKIVKRDPHRTQVWIELCNAYLVEQREFPELAKQRAGTPNWQGVINMQLNKNHCREDLPQLDHVTLNGKAADALVGAVKSSPKSALMYRGLGQAFLNDFEQTQNAGSLDLATVLFELAAARYPNQAHTYAELAACYHLAGNMNRQIENAGKAIELDDITPHSDQKMPPELRQVAETLAIMKNR